MPSRVRVMVAGTALITLIGVLVGCGVRSLNFRQDDRVTITSPAERSQVEPPVTVAWTVENFEIVGRDGSRREDAGYFGLLLDRPPPPPGRTQEWLIREDLVCEADPECPNEEYLAQRGIHSTQETELTIESIPDPNPSLDRREFHQVTIVLLNGRGQRIGESAFIVEFEVKR